MVIKIDKQLLFYCTWAFYSIFFFLFWASSLKTITNVYSILSIGNYCTGLFLIALIISKSYKEKDFLFFLLIALVVLIVFYKSDSTPLLIMLFAIAAKGIDYYKFIRFDLFLKIFWLIVILFLHVVEILPNVEGFYGTSQFGSYKSSLGFQHPNTLAIMVLTILLQWFILYLDSFKFRHLLVIAGVLVLLIHVTLSRAVIISFIVIVILSLLIRRAELNKSNTIFKALIVGFPIFAFGISYLFSILFIKGNKLILQLDSYLSHRIRLQAFSYSKYGISLFGNSISDDSSQLVVDNAYMKTLIIYGLLFSIIICILYCLTLYRAINENDKILLILCFYFLFLGFAESTIFRVGFNISLIAIFPEFSNKNILKSTHKVLRI